MPDAKAREVADNADLIVNGYAYTRCANNIRILNLRTGKAAVVNGSREVIETSMDDIDIALALRYLSDNEQFME